MATKMLKVALSIFGRKDRSVETSAKSAARDQRMLGTAISKTNSRLASSKEARKYGVILNGLKKKQSQLGYSSERLEHGIDEVEKRYNQARRAAKGYERGLEGVERQSRRTQDAGDRLSRSDIIRGTFALGGLAAAAAGRRAMQDEEALAYLSTVINAKDGDQNAAAQRSRLSARAFSRNRNTIVSEAELIRVEYEMNSAGLDEDAARFGARVGHQVAKVTRGSSEQVAAIMGTTYNTMGKALAGDTEQKLRRIGNVLTQTQLQYQFSNFGQLGAGLEYAIPTAVDNKVSLNQTAAIIGQMNSLGTSGSRAGTAFNAMMRSMGKAGDELGFSLARADDGTLDMMETLRRLQGSLSGLSIDDRNGALQTIFGDEGKVAVSPLLGALDELEGGFAKLNASVEGGVLEEKYGQFVKIAAGDTKRFFDSVVQLGSGLGDSLLPAMGLVLNVGTSVLNFVSMAIDKVPLLGTVIGVTALGFVGLAGAVTAAATWQFVWNTAIGLSTSRHLIGFLGNLRTGYALLGTRALPVAIAGMRAFSLAMLLNPIGLAVSALALGGFMLMKYWQPVKAFFKGLWREIGPPILQVVNAGKALFKYTPLAAMFRLLGDTVRFFGRGLSWAAGLFRPVTTGLDEAEDAGAAFGRMIKSVFVRSPIGQTIAVFRSVTDFITKRFERILELGKKVAKVIQTLAKINPANIGRSITERWKGRAEKKAEAKRKTVKGGRVARQEAAPNTLQKMFGFGGGKKPPKEPPIPVAANDRLVVSRPVVLEPREREIERHFKETYRQETHRDVLREHERHVETAAFAPVDRSAKTSDQPKARSSFFRNPFKRDTPSQPVIIPAQGAPIVNVSPVNSVIVTPSTPSVIRPAALAAPSAARQRPANDRLIQVSPSIDRSEIERERIETHRVSDVAKTTFHESVKEHSSHKQSEIIRETAAYADPVKAAERVMAVPAPVPTAVPAAPVYEGDTYHLHVNGVVDAEAFIRAVEPHMDAHIEAKKRRAQYD